jgi:hypothetical protein
VDFLRSGDHDVVRVRLLQLPFTVAKEPVFVCHGIAVAVLLLGRIMVVVLILFLFLFLFLYLCLCLKGGWIKWKSVGQVIILLGYQAAAAARLEGRYFIICIIISAVIWVFIVIVAAFTVSSYPVIIIRALLPFLTDAASFGSSDTTVRSIITTSSVIFSAVAGLFVVIVAIIIISIFPADLIHAHLFRRLFLLIGLLFFLLVAIVVLVVVILAVVDRRVQGGLDTVLIGALILLRGVPVDFALHELVMPCIGPGKVLLGVGVALMVEDDVGTRRGLREPEGVGVLALGIQGEDRLLRTDREGLGSNQSCPSIRVEGSSRLDKHETIIMQNTRFLN